MFTPFTLLISLASATANPTATPCPTPTPLPDLVSHLDAAEAAYGAFELETFETLSTRVFAELPCVSVAISPAIAARLHRLAGLDAYLDRDLPAAELAFAAARRADPDTAPFPAALVPSDPGQPEWAAFEAVDLSSGVRAPTPAPRGATLRFDGAADPSRPVSWPTLLQVEQRGQIALTAWLSPADPTPPLPTAPLVLPHAPELALGVGSVAAVATGAALYAGFLRGYVEHCDRGSQGSAVRRDCTEAEQIQPGYFDDVLRPRRDLGVAVMAAGGGGLATAGLVFVIRRPLEAR